jgi:uncharacterized protein YjbI with pentapeptide repeats
LAKCQFTTKYWDYESKALVDYNCNSKDGEVLDSGFCIFHDENYLQDKNNHKEREQEVVTKLMVKVNNSIDRKEALLCIGYRLPDIKIKGNFTKPLYFLQAKFQQIDFSLAKFSGEASFNSAEFSEKANFGSAKFSGEASFNSAKFSGEASFNSAKFSEKATFDSAEFSEAYFGSAEFSEAYFGSAEFSEKAIFFSAKFSEASFNSAKFSEASFNSAKFSEVDFGSAEFSKKAYFFSAKFSGEASLIQLNSLK